MSKIFYNKQFIDKNDLVSVKNSLGNKLITGGPNTFKFENLIKKKVNSKFALSCNSGTSAIHLALLSINVKKGDIVILPSINFIASFSMAINSGAKVYLADVCAKTGQMTPETLIECIKINNIKKIKLIVTMFLGGSPNNAVGFFRLKKKYKCYLIEDACHAFGASYLYKDKRLKVGSCKHADVSTFSFHPVKSITTGEGGALTTNNKEIFEKAKILRSHGIIRNRVKYYEYNINQLSFNYRLSDLNCALGISQIQKLDTIIKKRNKLFKIYCEKFKNLDKFIFIPNKLIKFQSHHLMLICIKNFNIKKKINLIKYLNKNRIFPQFHYIPLYKFRAVKSRVSGVYKSVGSNEYYSKFLSLPLFYDLNISTIDKVVKLLKNYLKKI